MKTEGAAELTPRQAARRLGVSLDSIYSLVWSGKLAGRQHDGRWLIPLAAVEARLLAKEKRLERRPATAS